MQISSSGSAPLFTNDALKEMWATKAAHKEQSGQAAPAQTGEEAPATSVTSATTTVASHATTSLTKASSGSLGEVMNSYMSGQPKGEDRYIRAKEMAASSANAMRTAQSSILAAGMMDAQVSSGSYAELVLVGKKAAANIERHQDKATLDESQRNLDEVADDVEERAEAAVNPEEGEAESTEKTDGAKKGEQKVEKVDKADQADVADNAATATASANAENVATESTSQPEQIVPTQPSVDIMV